MNDFVVICVSSFYELNVVVFNKVVDGLIFFYILFVFINKGINNENFFMGNFNYFFDWVVGGNGCV